MFARMIQLTAKPGQGKELDTDHDRTISTSSEATARFH